MSSPYQSGITNLEMMVETNVNNYTQEPGQAGSQQPQFQQFQGAKSLAQPVEFQDDEAKAEHGKRGDMLAISALSALHQ